MPVSEQFPPESVLEKDRNTRVARVVFGLTLYLDEPKAWAHGGASRALDLFLSCSRDRAALSWYTTSLLPGWRRASEDVDRSFVNALSAPLSSGLRHEFRFRWVDRPDVPDLGFSYREVSPEGRSRCSTLEVWFPAETDGQVVFELALAIGKELPVWCGVAGYQLGWNERVQSSAFSTAWFWARRYIGLDVQQSNLQAWRVERGLPGTNWLTLIGERFAKALQVPTDELLMHRWKNDVLAFPLRGGIGIRAGRLPTLGDVNRLVLPQAYFEVGRMLYPWVMAEPSEFWGTFKMRRDTAKWMRRFADDEWASG